MLARWSSSLLPGDQEPRHSPLEALGSGLAHSSSTRSDSHHAALVIARHQLNPGLRHRRLLPWVSGWGVSCLDSGRPPWAHGEPCPACWVPEAASFGVSRPEGGGLWDWAGPAPTCRPHWVVKGIWEGRDLRPGNLNLQLPPGSWWVSGRGVSCLDSGRPPWAHGEPCPGSQCAIGARLRLLAAWLGALGILFFQSLLN